MSFRINESSTFKTYTPYVPPTTTTKKNNKDGKDNDQKYESKTDEINKNQTRRFRSGFAISRGDNIDNCDTF